MFRISDVFQMVLTQRSNKIIQLLEYRDALHQHWVLLWGTQAVSALGDAEMNETWSPHVQRLPTWSGKWPQQYMRLSKVEGSKAAVLWTRKRKNCGDSSYIMVSPTLPGHKREPTGLLGGGNEKALDLMERAPHSLIRSCNSCRSCFYCSFIFFILQINMNKTKPHDSQSILSPEFLSQRQICTILFYFYDYKTEELNFIFAFINIP